MSEYLTYDQIRAICRQQPYQEQRRWLRAPYGILAGASGSCAFSWRGLLIERTGDYDIWRPYGIVCSDVGDGTCYPEPLYDYKTHQNAVSFIDPALGLIQYWVETAMGGFQWTLRDPRPIDGIPWEIHAIPNTVARIAATEAFISTSTETH